MCDTQKCVVCHEEKHWRRFRPRNNDGTYRESDTCSTCRSRIANAKTYKKNKAQKQVVLNRTNHQRMLELGVDHYYPSVEKAIRTYCNKRTAMDRKYLRDVQNKKAAPTHYLQEQRRIAIAHAQGWIAFYGDIEKHAIQLLRTTGTRPPFAQMEESSDLQKLYGLYNTRRAQRLRGA